MLPPGRFPIVDIPVTHAMFQTVFSVKRILQVPAISQWRRSGGETSERGHDSAVVNTRGIFDEKGRLMVLMTHNTDISDTWEREGEDIEYFYRFSPEGYAIAINVHGVRDDALRPTLTSYPSGTDSSRISALFACRQS